MALANKGLQITFEDGAVLDAKEAVHTIYQNVMSKPDEVAAMFVLEDNPYKAQVIANNKKHLLSNDYEEQLHAQKIQQITQGYKQYQEKRKQQQDVKTPTPNKQVSSTPIQTKNPIQPHVFKKGRSK